MLAKSFCKKFAIALTSLQWTHHPGPGKKKGQIACFVVAISNPSV